MVYVGEAGMGWDGGKGEIRPGNATVLFLHFLCSSSSPPLLPSFPNRYGPWNCPRGWLGDTTPRSGTQQEPPVVPTTSFSSSPLSPKHLRRAESSCPGRFASASMSMILRPEL